MASKFNKATGLAVSTTGVLYVADTGNNLIRVVTTAGVVTTLAGGATAGGTNPGYGDGIGSIATFRSPKAIVVDTVGSVFVADTGNNMIRKITSSG